MRCPACGASNPDGAAWCGQCYTSLGTPPAEDPVPPRPAGPAAASPPADTGPPRGSGGAPARRDPAADAHPAVRAEGDHIEWTCGVCGTTNPLDEFTCAVCGTRLDAALAPDVPEVDWDRARGRELLLPGAGHVIAGQAGIGIARMAMAVLWAIGGVLMLASGGTALLAAVPLLAGVAAIWATGPADLAAVRDGREPLLSARRLLWLVVGVTALFMLTGAVGAL